MKKLLACLLCLAMLIPMAGLAEANPLWTKPTEEVNLVFWYPLSGLYGELIEKLVDDYEAENPNIHIETSYAGNYEETRTKVAASLATGTQPDVLLDGGDAAHFTVGRDNHIFLELLPDPEFNVDDVFEGFLGQATYRGEVGAIPYGSSTLVMFYNKEIIKAAGLDMVNNPPKTWEEFIAVAQQAQEKGNIKNSSTFYGFDTNDVNWWYNCLMGQQGNFLVKFGEGDDVEFTYTNEDGERAAGVFKEMIDKGIMPVGEHANSANVFKAGNLAFFAGSCSWEPQMLDLEFEVGAIVLPSYSDAPCSALGGNQLTILATDPVKQAAGWDLIKYLTSAEKHAEWAIGSGYMPLRKSELTLPYVEEVMAENEMVKTAFAQAESGWPEPAFEHMRAMFATTVTALEEIENGTEIREALDNALDELLANIDY